MRRVSELYVRSDWQLFRFIYLPAAAVGLTPFNLCSLCTFCPWWAHHLEEWVRGKPLVALTETGLRYEDGGRPVNVAWADIDSLILCRRNPIPMWRTGGDMRLGTPPYWLAINMRRPLKSADDDGLHTVSVWPRQVRGGLPTMVRFARELQRRLIEQADKGRIGNLVPKKTGPKARLNGTG